MTRYLEGSTPRAFAHRGWHTGTFAGLENTTPAFAEAVAQGYRYLETDVHVTADGKLLAFHDHFLDRVTDASGQIAALPWEQVRKAKIGGREPIPLLEDLLGEFPQARFNIDPKSDRSVGPLVDVLRRTNSSDRVCIGAFSDRRLQSVRAALGPRVATSLGPRQVAALVGRARHLPIPFRTFGAVAAQVPVGQGRITVVNDAFVSQAHRRGLEVHVWTIDDPAQMRRLLDLGVDAIMTDRPDLLKQELQDRGVWDS
ncbi:glycerophosphodiester phosphodiesterase [Nakamurella antarctica]|uniref:Glycerophosphodiester phosphodiesterase n=1 Tax=Nakamurella antarctica TaxID=1902245 RepID=A0A3G8ZKT4_9ACTN|nr:glycerophosphodiester phosphodiesterase [Nakamurella antarctica]AZI57929.1 glycerophosphodiester phosphodiesterase [Nakamurella antarctica]